MFDYDGEVAFGKEGGDSITLREILDWWEAVAIRLEYKF